MTTWPRPTQIWCFACERGGVGKTSVTLAVAEAAVEQGARALVVDLDPQGNSSRRLLGVPEGSMETWDYRGPSVLDALRSEQPGDAVGQIVQSGDAWPDRLYLLASPGAALATFDQQRLAAADRRLARALRGIGTHTDIDLVLIDTAPSLGLLTQNGIGAASELVIVAQPVGAQQGVHETRRSAQMLYEEYGGRVRGVALTHVPARSQRSAREAEALQRWEAQDGLLARFPKSSVWTTAEADARPLLSYLTDFGRGASAQRALTEAKKILGHLPQEATA